MPIRELKKIDFSFSDIFYKKCEKYADILLKYNKTHNITGAKTKKDVYENIYDSIYPINLFEKAKNAVDIGTGAGFPGLILAMAKPDCEFTLFEPITKKSSFLYLAKGQLGLKNVKIQNRRIEEGASFKADVITSRAVMETKLLMKLCSNFIKKDSIVILYKGENVKNEISENLNYEILERGKRRYLILRNMNDF